MNDVLKYLFTEYNSKNEANLLRKLLYVFVIFKCLYWFMDIDLLFGNESLVYKNNVHLSTLKSTAFILFNSESTGMVYSFLIGALLFSGLGLINNYFSRLTAFVIWFIVVNIDNSIYPTLTGGDFLFQQLLFFNIFLSGFRPNYTEVQLEVEKAFHNAGVAALKIQICLVYLMSALSKLIDADWQSGEAVAQTFLVHDFSLPVLYNNIKSGSFILSLITYLIIAYQITFPIFIWMNKLKKPFLAFGILQHLIIAFIMGLPTFGFIMIIAYSIFYAPAFLLKKSL